MIPGNSNDKVSIIRGPYLAGGGGSCSPSRPNSGESALFDKEVAL